MPKRAPRQPKPLYRVRPPKPAADALPAGTPLEPAHFELREDGTVLATAGEARRAPRLVFADPARRLWLYQGNCLELLDAIAAKYPEGRFDCIFADPPYFLSNGGITCHAGRMVRVDKGDWDKSRGPELNHEFNLEWLRRCQRVLKPNGTLWVSGTHHVIFSIGYALQQLGFKLLNVITWEKPNPPPNLSCRYFTHSTETLLWAAKNEKSRHTFNYPAMKAVTGKQMKTVWRDLGGPASTPAENQTGHTPEPVPPGETSIWTIPAPGREEKTFGKHPTQKPVALIERCLLASTHEGELVLDPFLGSGTTAVACLRLHRGCVGIELDAAHLVLGIRRADREIVRLWLREFQVRVEVEIFSANDLDLIRSAVDRIKPMADGEPQTERIFHETKFVFLSCAEVSSASVVHTTVDVSLAEAWAKTPGGKRRETTHIIRCQTEILRVRRELSP